MDVKIKGEEIDFEQAVCRLEQIITMMESKELPLDDSLQMFEEGIRLYRICKEKLEGAEKKITEIVKLNGEYREIDFLSSGEDKDGF